MISCILNCKIGDSIEFSSKDDFADLLKGEVVEKNSLLLRKYPSGNYPVVGCKVRCYGRWISDYHSITIPSSARNRFSYFYLIYPGYFKVHKILKKKADKNV